MASVTINGNTYNDLSYNASTNAGGLGNGGHRINFINLISDVVTVADEVDTNATAAAASAAAAAASAATAVAAESSGFNNTSITSLAIGTGSKAFVVATDLPYTTAHYIKAVDASNSANYMFGNVAGYDSGSKTLTLDVTLTSGSGTIANWILAASGPRGATGATGDVSLAGVETLTNKTLDDSTLTDFNDYHSYLLKGAPLGTYDLIRNAPYNEDSVSFYGECTTGDFTCDLIINSVVVATVTVTSGGNNTDSTVSAGIIAGQDVQVEVTSRSADCTGAYVDYKTKRDVTLG